MYQESPPSPGVKVTRTRLTLSTCLQTITNDNFELGCTIIEKSATDKAIRDINERLAPAFQARQKASASGQPYFDANMLQGRFPQVTPPPPPFCPCNERFFF